MADDENAGIGRGRERNWKYFSQQQRPHSLGKGLWGIGQAFLWSNLERVRFRFDDSCLPSMREQSQIYSQKNSQKLSPNVSTLFWKRQTFGAPSNPSGNFGCQKTTHARADGASENKKTCQRRRQSLLPDTIVAAMKVCHQNTHRILLNLWWKHET